MTLGSHRFVDLAGSERLTDAHGLADWRSANLGTIEGVCTNMSAADTPQPNRF